MQVNGVLADKNYVMQAARSSSSSSGSRTPTTRSCPSTTSGVIPGNFDQAVSIVAIGRYQDDHFEAEQLLVKCPSKYQAEAEREAKTS